MSVDQKVSGVGASRRRFMRLGLALTPLVAVAMAPRQLFAAEGECVDPSEMEGLRASLGYVEKSPDAKQTCKQCAFFNSNEQDGACGPCQIFHGPVNEAGYCQSWSKAG